MKTPAVLLIVVFAACIQNRLNAQPGDSLRTDTYLITHVSVVDVEKGEIQENRTVEIRNGLIARITPRSGGDETSRHTVINGKGLFMIPGLFDAHVHYYDEAVYGKMMIAYGVLFVRDMGNSTPAALAVRERLNSRKILGPEMITTGSILDGDPPTIPQIAIGCATPEAGREAVRKQVAAGVDQIKVYSGLRSEVFLAIADEAGKHGIKVVGHVPEAVYIEDAARAGMKSSEHLFGFGKLVAKALGDPVDFSTRGMGTDIPYFLRLKDVHTEEFQAALRWIGSTGMHVCPTLVVFKHGAHYKEIFSGNYPMLEYTSPMMKGFWKALWGSQPENGIVQKILPAMEEVVKQLSVNGVPLMVGTDLLSPGVIPGYSVHEEMVLLQEAGLSPADILRSATIIPAKFIGVDNRLGTIAERKTASFVLLRSNPLEDIRNVDQIECVFSRGRYFSRADLDRLLQDVKNQCAGTN